jgi:hypothetical protein
VNSKVAVVASVSPDGPDTIVVVGPAGGATATVHEYRAGGPCVPTPFTAKLWPPFASPA